MKVLLTLALVMTSLSASAVSIKCEYKEFGKRVLKVTGRLNQDGGTLKLRGSYVLGDRRSKKLKFYRRKRSNEAELKFAKYTVKTDEQYKNKKWITPFYRISIDKKALDKKVKKFDAYFGFHTTEAPDENVLEELPVMKCKKRIF